MAAIFTIAAIVVVLIIFVTWVCYSVGDDEDASPFDWEDDNY